MSGPFPPPGYPRQPEQGGWPGSQPTGQGPTGQYGPPGYSGEFPAQPNYGGLNGGPGWGGGMGGGIGGGEDPGRPPKQKHLARTVIGVVSVVVIVAGVATGIVLLTNRHPSSQAGGGGGTTSTAPSVPGGGSGASGGNNGGSGESTGNGGSGDSSGATVVAGRTDQDLSAGQCVTAQVGDSGQYDIGDKTTCGQSDSDLLLAKAAGDESGCTAHQYLLVQGPSQYYCFTLDVKQGDCLDESYLKADCSDGEYVVLATEPGPGSSNSCKDQADASHWVPVGPDPVTVGCLGPDAKH